MVQPQIEKTTMTEYTVGAVHLNVHNIDNMVRFYQDIIGLQVHYRDNAIVRLGVGESDLLILHHTPDFQRGRGLTGLYHLAILVPSRVQLAKSLRHLAQTQTRLQGLSDHAVSEAIYLADPEGNGIEIYHDRPREQWYDANGNFLLTTVAMDVEGVMNTLTQANSGWEGLPQGTIIGHIHLHVSDISQTETFYRDVLGMDIMANIGSASFMSYDGYHHHLGANIWGGRTPATSPVLGLREYELTIHDTKRWDDLLAILDAQSVEFTQQENGLTLRDPSHNQIVCQTV